MRVSNAATVICRLETYIDFGIIWNSCEGLIQCSMHLLRCSFEESTTACSILISTILDSGVPFRVHNSPPWNRVSPVNIAFPVESSIKKQMLSCVWHGVYNALTVMSPILRVSPFLGVFVTLWQSLPPMMGLPLNSEYDNYWK